MFSYIYSSIYIYHIYDLVYIFNIYIFRVHIFYIYIKILEVQDFNPNEKLQFLEKSVSEP